MKSVILVLGTTVLLTTAVFAQSPYYVVTNDDNNSNSATVFNLNPSNGTLTQVKVLETGGEAQQGGYFAGATQVITPGGTCVFVADGGGATDIAAFSKMTNYGKVGNYGDSSLQGASNMPMLENGTLLYAAYELSSALAVWTINPDCSLTLANVYPTDPFLGSMAMTHDHKRLLVTYEIVREVGSFTISGSTLANDGTIHTPLQPSGIAVTNDDRLVIIGTAYNMQHPDTVITANLPSFINQKEWTLGPGYSAGSVALSPDGAAGNGCLYVGNTGAGSSGQAGVTGVQFTENPLSLAYVNNVTSPLPTLLGNVALISDTGNGMGVYAAETAGYIGVYTADSGCNITLQKETADPNATFILSLSSFVR